MNATLVKGGYSDVSGFGAEAGRARNESDEEAPAKYAALAFDPTTPPP